MAFFLERLPGPLLTRDQITLLKYDSISKKGLSNLKTVVTNPLSMETALKLTFNFVWINFFFFFMYFLIF